MYRQHYPNDPGMHNMPNAYDTRASPYRDMTAWEHVKRSFLAIIVGILILTIASGVVFWNEGRAVQTSQSLDEGLRAVRILRSTEVIFDENNGKLVHVSGTLRTSQVLYDDSYNIAIHAVKLRRTVEMYQWVEHENKREVYDGDSTHEEVSYDYREEWRTDLISSNSFNNMLHVNPDKFPIESRMQVANDAQVGSFDLAKTLVEKVTNFHKIQPKDILRDPGIQLYNGMYYHSHNPSYPQVGDLRVTFEYAGLSSGDLSSIGPPDIVSILARQLGTQLVPYQADAGDEIEILYQGQHSAEHMIGAEKMSNAMLLWGLRFVGWLLMFIGFGCLTTFVTNMADSIPILRELVVLGAVSFSVTLSLSLSLIVIGLGWIWYRPYLGLTVLVLAVLPFLISHLRYQRSRAYRPV